MCLHLVNLAVPRSNVKKLLSGGAKILKNLEEETGTTHSHSSLDCGLQCRSVHAMAVAPFPFESISCNLRQIDRQKSKREITIKSFLKT